MARLPAGLVREGRARPVRAMARLPAGLLSFPQVARDDLGELGMERRIAEVLDTALGGDDEVVGGLSVDSSGPKRGLGPERFPDPALQLRAQDGVSDLARHRDPEATFAWPARQELEDEMLAVDPESLILNPQEVAPNEDTRGLREALGGKRLIVARTHPTISSGSRPSGACAPSCGAPR